MRVKTVLTGAGVVAVVGVFATATAAPQASLSRPGVARYVQEYAITIVPSSQGNTDARVSGPNFAIAPDVPVSLTFTNFTSQVHTFTIPGLGVTAVIPAAHGQTPAKTTIRFTATAWGTFSWYCVVCKSGYHGPRHAMGGKVYAIIDPAVFAA